MAALPILKGPTFQTRLREVFAASGPLPRHPLAGIVHRRILIPGLTGGEIQFALLGCIGQALRIRGAEVTALLCDELLPACTLRKVDHVETACTRWCHRHSPGFIDALRLPHRWYGQLLAPDVRVRCDERAERTPDDRLLDVVHRGVALGEHLLRSLECYYKVGRADLDDPDVIVQARAFLRAGLYLIEIASRAIDELGIDKLLLDDGRKTDWGVFRAVARQRGIPVDVIGIGIRGTSVRFEIDRPPADTVRMPGWALWRDEPLTGDQERALDDYLAARERVPYEYRDACWHSDVTSPAQAARRLGIPADAGGFTLAMFPNVGFDAGKTATADAAFPNAADWAAATVEAVARHTEHTLIIKGHPAEHHRRARDSVIGAIKARFDPLPKNVRLIDSETDLSAHAIVRLADVVLTYTSTVTVEAAALGKPVILAGGGWHAGRGFVEEVRDPRAYRDLLAGILERGHLPATRRDLARRYAYALFFRNDIPITHFERRDMNVTALTITSPQDLVPDGGDRSIDAICRGILLDEPFENPLVPVPEPARAAS